LCDRGVDWQWEDQDGGNGRRGKVTEVQVQSIGDFAHLLDSLSQSTGNELTRGPPELVQHFRL
jgi:hypothetical protein